MAFSEGSDMSRHAPCKGADNATIDVVAAFQCTHHPPRAVPAGKHGEDGGCQWVEQKGRYWGSG